MPTAPKIVWWLDSNFLSVKKACPAKYEWVNGTYKSVFVTNDYTLSDFVGHPIFQLGSMNSDKEIVSNH